MFEIGASLAAARRERGLGVRDAEQLTCMRAKYLTALEEDRFDELPGRTYARAFLRTYAAALGLQADRFVAEFDAQQPEPEEEDDVREFRPRQPIRIPTSIPALAAVAVCALLVWSAWTGDQTLNPTVQPPAAPVASAAVKGQAKIRVAPAAPAATAVVVRATLGPCWIEAHRGSEYGPLLARRTLVKGETATFAAPRVWLRLGAPWNVVVRRGAHVARGLSATGPSNVTL
ncbi:MAG: helix-turn-helix domain-containing protein [Gaiellaceae bacterium]